MPFVSARKNASPDRIWHDALLSLPWRIPMANTGALEGKLAQLLLSWLKQCKWDEELFKLSCGFIMDFIPGNSEEYPKDEFPKNPNSTEALALRDFCSNKLLPIAEACQNNPAIIEIASRFNLLPTETRLLGFFSIYCQYSHLESYFDRLPEWDKLGRLAVFTGFDENALLNSMRNSGKLMRLGIGSTSGRGLRLDQHGAFFGLNEIILSYIWAGTEYPLSSYILGTDSRECLPLSTFDLPAITIETAKAALSKTEGESTVLLYGKPGTGKTEFARSLCMTIGMRPCYLKHDSDSGERKFEDLLLAARLMDPRSEVLIVDEADELLNLESFLFFAPTNGIKKGMVNNFLDDSKARIIFISNEIDRIPDSILRRFTFHLAFEDFTPAKRAKIWDSLCEGKKLFAESEKNNLAWHYKANPARIKQVVEVCSSLSPDYQKEITPYDIAKEMLSRSDEIMYDIPRNIEEPNRSYNPSLLNINTRIESLIQGLEAWKARFEGRKHGINMLLYGASGTGKTAFARYLAGRLNMNPIIMSGSDLMSRYVGETEKLIHQAFVEAAGGVLIFDEADGLLSSRESAQYGWERTRTNEILTAMESFKGFFIASTNFKTILDSASLRRFTYKIEFRETAPERRQELVSGYFPEVQWSERDHEALQQLDFLTPGDVAIVAQRLEFATALSSSMIIDELRTEIGSRQPIHATIGF
jgi:tRNA A37 threonylcarbamoyladenosine biosynthesis protein TsaE